MLPIEARHPPEFPEKGRERHRRVSLRQLPNASQFAGRFNFAESRAFEGVEQSGCMLAAPVRSAGDQVQLDRVARRESGS